MTEENGEPYREIIEAGITALDEGASDLRKRANEMRRVWPWYLMMFDILAVGSLGVAAIERSLGTPVTRSELLLILGIALFGLGYHAFVTRMVRLEEKDAAQFTNGADAVEQMLEDELDIGE